MYLIDNKQIELLNPKKFGLNSRAILGKISNNKLILIKDRKSRIIMKDGIKILEQIEGVKKISNNDMALATNASICSKTIKFFKEHKIKVYQLQKEYVRTEV